MNADAERWAEAAAWSRRTTLTPLETVLWRSEEHPRQSATSTTLMRLDRAPVRRRFREAHDWATRLVPRLRERVAEAPLPAGSPTWVPDAGFDLDRHLAEVDLGGEGTHANVLGVAERTALASLDREHPPWQAVLVTGLADGTAAYVLTVHHVLADALGTLQLLSLVQSRTRRHTADKPVSPEPPAPGPGDPVARLAHGAGRAAVRAPGLGRALTARALQAARDPIGALSASLRYGGSLRRLVSLPAAPSPLLAGRDGTGWTFFTLEVPLGGMREAGRAAGGSLEDAFTAAVLDGVGRYHERLGEPLESLPVSLRVSLDPADDPLGGNRFAGAVIAGPAGALDAADRIAAVRGEVLSLYTESALEATAALAPVLQRLPAEVARTALERGPAADVFVTTLPGPGRKPYVAGARVDSMHVLGPLPGTAVTATLVSFADEACVGLNVDATGVADPDLLVSCVAEGLARTAAADRARGPGALA